MNSNKAVVAFADAMLQHFTPYKWDEHQEKAWAATLVRELSGFTTEVIERASREIIRTRKKPQTPMISECIQACVDAKRWLDAEKPAQVPLTDVSQREGAFSTAREILVNDVLLKTEIAKTAAREGWIGLLNSYCFEHGKLPTEKDEISRLKREAKDIDAWSGDNPNVIRAKVAILEKRQALADRVLKGAR